MASAAQSLRFAARSRSLKRIPMPSSYSCIADQRVFSTISPLQARRREQEESEEIDEREATLRRNLQRMPQLPKQKPGFQNMGEGQSGMDMVLEDEDFGEDDISSLAHKQLDEHRERREFLRIAAWEMPLLSEMAKPFQLPTSEQPLRFRYTSYLGEYHPAEKKVVVEFCVDDMPNLKDRQKTKFMKLLGSRYNPETNIAKMSCDSFESQAQNKRYLGDMVERLIEEAKDETDLFEDVPLDTRHHPIREKPRFPKEWRIDEQRQAALNGARKEARLLEAAKIERGELLDGSSIIKEALTSPRSADLQQLLVTAKKQSRGQAQRRI